jgi:hypothetical protein
VPGANIPMGSSNAVIVARQLCCVRVVDPAGVPARNDPCEDDLIWHLAWKDALLGHVFVCGLLVLFEITARE